MNLSQIDKIRGNFLQENTRFFSVALKNIHSEVMAWAKSSGSSFIFEYRLSVDFDRMARGHFARAYDQMWNRTPVYFATQTFKELSNTKALADIFNPINAFRGNLNQRVAMVTATTQGKYMGLLKEGRTLTNDIFEIAKLMDTNVRGAYIRLRAMQIARTETVFASNAGRQAGAKATNLPIIKTWVTMQDEKVRNHHMLANGQQRRLSEAFVVNGELMRFPSDFTLGASADNLINCRCSEIYTIAN